MGYALLPYQRFFDFSGRARPKEYWLYLLFYAVQLTIALVVDIQFGLGGEATSYAEFGDGSASVGFNATLGIVSAIVMLVNLIPGIAVSVRRAHDSDRRGWWLLVPFYNFILMFFDGTRGPNRFGPDPTVETPSQIFS